MQASTRVVFNRLPSGVPGLDEVLGGGFPEFSFNVIAGGPGTGKTTLANQIVFANASSQRRVLYFSILGETPLKMLRYQQQYTFFDSERVGDTGVRFVNLSYMVLEQDLGRVLDRIVRDVEGETSSIVVVDSFRTLVQSLTRSALSVTELDAFLQRLAIHLTVWKATTFLVGEYTETEVAHNPLFTVADGIVWLTQTVVRSSVVRKAQVVKVRGQDPIPGLHTMRITQDGVRVFPRMLQRPNGRTQRDLPAARLSFGLPALDGMMGGGIPAGDALLVAGPAGSGKTTLAAHFIAEGLKQGEPGVVAFEEYPQDYVAHTTGLGVDLEDQLRQGKLAVIGLRPLDLSVDETLYELGQQVERLDATRVVIDSLTGFEIALAPPYRDDFRESLYRMIGTLTGMGVTVLMTIETSEPFGDMRFTPDAVSFLTDDIILQRYLEVDGELRRVMTVVKMRGGNHAHDFRQYDVGPQGLVIGEPLQGYRGIVTGMPEPIGGPP